MEKANAEEVSGSYEYTCEVDSSLVSMDIDMTVEPSMSIPDSVEANESIDIEGITTEIELDLSVLGPLASAVDPLDGKVNQLNLEGNGEVENILGDGVDIPSTDQDDDNRATFTVEGTDTSFTAGEDDVEILAGDIEAEIHAVGKELPVVCTPDEDTVITTVEVEEEEVDEVAPEITLNGDNPMELEVGEEYEEPGATAEDDVDGDVSDDIVISGEVNTEEEGEYEVTYTVSDAAGNEAEEVRTVNVMEVEDGEGKALNDVNNASTPEEMQTALESDGLGIVEGYSAYNDRSAYEKIIIAEEILEAQSEEAFETIEEVDKLLISTVGNIISPFGDKIPKLEAFKSVNNADDAETMRDALENEDLAVDLSVYEELYGYEQAEVAAIILEKRPEEGYSLPNDIEEVMDRALERINAAKWFSGEGEPNAELGEEKDLYLNEDNYDIYKKTEDGWNKIGNIKGESGSDGENGEAGNDGETGEAGVDGATWLVGEGKPGEEEGNANDLYLDTNTGDVYLKSDENWELVTNIKGEDGIDGEDGKDGSDGKDGKDGKNGSDGNDDKTGKNGSNGVKNDKDSDNDDSVVSVSDNNSTNKPGTLPNTATNTPTLIAIGSSLLLVGGAVLLIRRRRLMN